MLRFENILLKFDKKTILSNFNLEIGRGDKILISGKSGIGKSTLFKMVLGFVRPDEGDIYFDGQIYDSQTAWEIRKQTSYVSQNPDIGDGRVQDLIKDILDYKANDWLHKEHVRPEEYLDLLELSGEILRENIETLSGGEKQRIAILIALMLKRKFFILDEPTAFLDADLKKKVAGIFADRKDWTVIVTSHDPCWKKTGHFKTVSLR